METTGNRAGPYKTLKNAVNVHDADVHNVVINDYMHRHTAVSTTLSAAVSKGAVAIPVVSSAGFTLGSYVHMGPLLQSGEPIHPEITLVPAGNVITLDRPLDNDYPAGTLVTQAIVNIASLGGTLAAPVSYKYRPRSGANRVEHINRVIVSMIHSGAADDSLFGNLARLLNGVVLRASVGGVVGTLTNWKSNSDLYLDTGSLAYTDKAGPNLFGTRSVGSFKEISVALPLSFDTADYLEMLIQDATITQLTRFRVKVQGHIEGM